jgi:hypothetical protein
MPRPRNPGKPGALQEAIQTLVAASIAGITEKFKTMEKEISDQARAIEKLTSTLNAHREEDHEGGMDLSAVDRSIKLALAELEEKLPARVDGILAAQLSTPMEAVLKLPAIEKPRKAQASRGSGGARPAKPRPAADKPTTGAKKGWKLKPCPTPGCKGKLCAVDRYKPTEHFECKKCGYGKPGAAAA